MEDREEHPRTALIRFEVGLRHWILAVLCPGMPAKCEETMLMLRPVTPPSAPPQIRLPRQQARS